MLYKLPIYYLLSGISVAKDVSNKHKNCSNTLSSSYTKCTIADPIY